MNEKELYKQKFQAHLDEWKADISKLKARASGASADAQLAMNRQAAVLEGRLEDAQAKLSGLSEAGEDAWVSLKNGADAAWESLKTGIHDASGMLRD